ncbi:MAG: sporulation protein [Clostridiales bacterium]|nr:MAG: sporulation protein [Clostridiales bacterium]
MGFIIKNLYSMTGMYVLSIVILTIIVKTALLPLVLSQLKSQEALSKIQPKLKELQKKYKNDKETLNIKTMELYKENNANPFASCLPLLIQLPIIIALFAVLKEPEVYIFSSFANQGKEIIESGFLWVPNLAQPDMLNNVINLSFSKSIPGLLPIAAAILTYLQFVVASPMASMDEQSQSMTKNMKMIMPVMILLFSSSMSAGLVIYWVVSNVYQICQQVLIKKIKDSKKYKEEEAI